MVRFFIILFFVVCGGQVFSQVKLFSSHEPLRISIVTDLRALIRDVDTSTARYHAGTLSYIHPDGSPTTIKVKLRTRGIFRRNRQNCTLPPLTVKFNADTSAQAEFDGINKLKLVNVCKRSKPSYNQYLVKEYLAYRMYNLLTDFSFRVRFVFISYIDINSKIEPFESVGFFIEDVKFFHARTNSVPLKTLGIVQDATNRSAIDLMTIFQYMIGNTDWSVPKLHNIKLVLPNNSLVPIAIPYDFDFCGFVNPPYTKPPEIIPITHVTQRYYRGFCRSSAELEPSVAHFIKTKDDIYYLIQSDTLLNSKHKSHVINYLDDFFNIISSPKLIQNQMLINCRSN